MNTTFTGHAQSFRRKDVFENVYEHTTALIHMYTFVLTVLSDRRVKAAQTIIAHFRKISIA